ncbi:MAG TPA: 23S rRNA (guanosine(2251)-2'-O)-methyltransferase RlmB [Micropepsaceae bacterium]|nr:23S rRNA (guanosine(2251)-2'-O)-methyltransferase RlmB [Micropepsaceae bacterium]
MRAFGSRMTHRDRPSRIDQRRALSGRGYWLYGFHAARAALGNPTRTITRALLAEAVAPKLEGVLGEVPTEICNPQKIAQALPKDAVHQGVALLCEPLPERDLDEVIETSPPGTRRFAVLDQITDPHNEGAILRSAAAFGFTGVVVQARHSPPESGVLAKAASGALDQIPRITVVNIARALEDMARFGIWRIALAADGPEDIRAALNGNDVALVLGAEGSGVRRLVRERCDITAHIPMRGKIESLNVSNAAAIALYEIARSAK